MENHTMTLDELARMIQGEFTAVRDEVRTGFDAVHETLKRHDDEFVRMHEEMETGFSRVALILKSIHEDIQDFKKVKIEVAELRNRVERLEARLGIAK